MDAAPTSDYRLFLQRELSERRAHNPRYSMRAFAQNLGISPSGLCQILSGKRPLARRTADTIADRLGLAPDARAALLGAPQPYQKISVDDFNVIAEWYHYGILALAHLDDHQTDTAWVAARLGIGVREARAGISRLKRLGLLAEDSGRFRQTTRPLSTPLGISSAAVRSFHRQILSKAIASLELDPAEDRDMGAVTMTIGRDKLPQARELIKTFRREMRALMEHGPKESIYVLSTQLFPLEAKARRPS